MPNPDLRLPVPAPKLQGFIFGSSSPGSTSPNMQTIPIIYSIKPFVRLSVIFWQNPASMACLRHGLPLLFPASSVPTFSHPPWQASGSGTDCTECPPLACALNSPGQPSSLTPLWTGHPQLILQGTAERSVSSRTPSYYRTPPPGRQEACQSCSLLCARQLPNVWHFAGPR